jgi:hypothetical protein
MSFELQLDLKEDNTLSLENIFTDLFLFVDELIKDYGDPVEPSIADIELLKKRIIQQDQADVLFHQKHFYLIERVKGEVLFAHNVDKYLGLSGDFDLMEFHSRIQDGVTGWHYLNDYLSWGKIAYLFFQQIGNFDDLNAFSFKIHLPMICADGNVYWVLQESKPLEYDARGNMISHLNIYTISSLYHLEKPVNLHGEFYRNDLYCKDWNEMYQASRMMVCPFLLTPVQREIVCFFHAHPDATRQACAEFLKYPLNTIKKYISDCQHKQGIIDKAHAAFPHIPIRNLKDVVKHLAKIGLIDTWGCGYKDSKNGYSLQ